MRYLHTFVVANNHLKLSETSLAYFRFSVYFSQYYRPTFLWLFVIWLLPIYSFIVLFLQSSPNVSGKPLNISPFLACVNILRSCGILVIVLFVSSFLAVLFHLISLFLEVCGS